MSKRCYRITFYESYSIHYCLNKKISRTKSFTSFEFWFTSQEYFKVFHIWIILCKSFFQVLFKVFKMLKYPQFILLLSYLRNVVTFKIWMNYFQSVLLLTICKSQKNNEDLFILPFKISRVFLGYNLNKYKKRCFQIELKLDTDTYLNISWIMSPYPLLFSSKRALIDLVSQFSPICNGLINGAGQRDIRIILHVQISPWFLFWPFSLSYFLKVRIIFVICYYPFLVSYFLNNFVGSGQCFI